jgi:hypothetical protein
MVLSTNPGPTPIPRRLPCENLEFQGSLAAPYWSIERPTLATLKECEIGSLGREGVNMVVELCRLLIWWSTFSFHGASGECHRGRDLETSDGGSSLCGEEELALLIRDLEQLHVRWGDCIGELQSLTFQGENPRSGLNWFCLAMALLKALFCEWGLSSNWKFKMHDRAATVLVHCSVLGGVTFGKARLLVLSWWC